MGIAISSFLSRICAVLSLNLKFDLFCVLGIFDLFYTFEWKYDFFYLFGLYEVKSKNEDHSIFFKCWTFNLKIKSILIKFNPLGRTFVKTARLYEKLDFYAIIQLKMSSLCTRSVTVGRLWSPTK